MEKDIRIALLTNNDDDVYCFRLELIQDMLLEGYEVLVSCPTGPKLELMQNIPLIWDNPVIDRRGTNPMKDGLLLLHYYKLLQRYQPDVVLTYTAKPNVYGGFAAQKLKIPVISNVTGIGSVGRLSGLKKTAILKLFKAAFRGSACIMFQNSENMRLANELGWVKGRQRLIPGSGVALERFPLQEYPDGGDGLSGPPVVFNYIGRILHDKGVDDYIEAAKCVKAKYPNTEFNMLGFIEPTENHYEAELRDLEKQGILFYRGSQQDVRPWIKRAHCIIHPSTYGEGISNVLLENASSGRPIITTNHPGCMETVEDGISGFLYAGGDTQQLVEKISCFLSMDGIQRKAMGLAGRNKVEHEFSRVTVINAYLEEIKKII